jgi:predicted nucleic acid-binding protein
LLDNDILLKMSAWQLDGPLTDCTTTAAGLPAMLGVAAFVIRRKIGKIGLQDPTAAGAAFTRLSDALAIVEPTEEELKTAADLEEAANRADLQFDTGESQLAAILLHRGAALLATGDKRAISALATLAPAELAGRVASLEALLCQIVTRIGIETARAHICREPAIDRSAAICFACHRHDLVLAADVETCLASYLGDLGKVAGPILISNPALSALAA